MYIGLHVKYRCSCPIVMKPEFYGQIFEKYKNIKFHENPSCGSRVVPCGRTDGQTDMTKLIVAFRNFANAPKKCFLKAYVYSMSERSAQRSMTHGVNIYYQNLGFAAAPKTGVM